MCNDKQLIETYRQRFSSISWFMFYLNHEISVRINQADGTKGRVWSGPFYSDYLGTVDKLLSAMVYVDLNPIRAGIAPVAREQSPQAFCLDYENGGALGPWSCALRRVSTSLNQTAADQPR
jgi:hypothetical protein